jgi:hypothetical protein
MPMHTSPYATLAGACHSCRSSQHSVCKSADCACPYPKHAKRTQDSEPSGDESPARRAWQTRRARQDSDKTGETAPKRPEIKSGAKSAIPAAAARQIKSEFALLLWGADAAAAAAAPALWTTPDDRLQEQERTALVNATYNELEARCPELLKILAKAQESATEAALIYTVAMIAAPRLARHGVIPESFASAILFAPLIAQSVASREPGASAVGAEPAPQPDRANGYGQIDVGQPLVEGAPVHAGAAVQAGLSDLLNRSGDTDGARNGRYPE